MPEEIVETPQTGAPEPPNLDMTLEEMAKSEPAIEPSADPITPESVESDKAPDESLPDSSLVAQRLQTHVQRYQAEEQEQSASQKVEELQKQVELLRTLRGAGFEEQYAEAQSKAGTAKAEDPDLLKELRAELNTMREGQAQLQQELEQRQQNALLQQAQADVVSWVKDQKEHFPLLNEIGQQALVFQKMQNEHYRTGQYISEAQAGREVEAEIAAIVERCAPQLGYTKGNVEQRREESVSVGAGAMSMTDPLDLNSMNDEEALEALITNANKQQR